MTEDKHKEIKCLGEEGAALIQIVDPHLQKIASIRRAWRWICCWNAPTAPLPPSRSS